ncbi:TPA: hypothetical protein ACH3X2_004755 [Trebouxia sp. C0005]
MQAGSQATQEGNQAKLGDRIVSGAKESWSDKTSSVPGGGEGTIKDEAKSAASGTASQPAVSATKADKMMTDPGQS